jgi:hypothetical protein
VTSDRVKAWAALGVATVGYSAGCAADVFVIVHRFCDDVVDCLIGPLEDR